MLNIGQILAVIKHSVNLAWLEVSGIESLLAGSAQGIF